MTFSLRSTPFLDQARMERAERARLAVLKRQGERTVIALQEIKQAAAERLEKAKLFPPGTPVKLGKQVGKVVSVNPQSGALCVRVAGYRIDKQWMPDYVELAWRNF